MTETNASPSAWDRRSLLKGGAAAGLGVWAAPMIQALPAHAADGTCTPKCFPDRLQVDIRAWDICWSTATEPSTVTIDGVVFPIPVAAPGIILDNSTKAALVQLVGNATGVCPCSDDTQSEIRIISLPSSWTEGTCPTNPADPRAEKVPETYLDVSGTVEIGPGFFWLGKQGAINDGTYRPCDPAVFELGPCFDKGGDEIILRCTGKPGFTYSPAGSACDRTGPIGSADIVPDPDTTCDVLCNGVLV